MLADVEDDGVVHVEAGALRLRDVEVVAGGVWSRMPQEEVEWRVLAYVGDREGYGQSVWI